MYKLILTFLLLTCSLLQISVGQSVTNHTTMFTPRSFEDASRMADSVLALMTLDEKISYVGGDRNFFIRPIPRLGLHEVGMSDATQGVHIRAGRNEAKPAGSQLEQSTAFPCPLCLAATWDPELAYTYARAIGEECRAGNIGILLGPGQNVYRISQCGRNFEYFGEDPFLRASLIGEYVQGVQSTGTVATLKHFVANNTDYFRRRSNSIVDERTLHEIYLPSFKAGIDAGATAVMTSYNQLNGEWCGQSSYVINDLLRKQLGFKWLVMTDWWSVYEGQKVATSGQDLEMPFALALKDVKSLIDEGMVTVADIDSMVANILRTYFAMRFDERQPGTVDPEMFPKHEQVALQAAREGIVLLKNVGGILPIKSNIKSILLTGTFVDSLAYGDGSAEVKGYNIHLMLEEMKKQFGDRLSFVKNPTVAQITKADVVLCNLGTHDSEGSDRPFALPEDQERLVTKCVTNNPNTVVIVTSGSGIRMSEWNDKAKAILYAWYPGQIGNQALAEIVAGKVGPSGRLPITIERDFKDSPGYGYIPEGESLYSGWNDKAEKDHPIYDIQYKEGILVGYRWYDTKNIKPLYWFGHGLTYTTFKYSDLKLSRKTMGRNEFVSVSFAVKNTGERSGTEVAQMYVHQDQPSVLRPAKELKGFARVDLKPGEEKTVSIDLRDDAFAHWDSSSKGWLADKGTYEILVGSSSNEIHLKNSIVLTE